MKLAYDPNFTACPTKENDELRNNGIFQFNITEIMKFIENSPRVVSLITVNTKDYHIFRDLDQDYVDTVDYKRPGIIAEISPGNYNFIDGNHRLLKAKQDGIKEIQVYRLLVEQHISYLTSKESYKKYIEYWNEKVGDII